MWRAYDRAGFQTIALSSSELYDPRTGAWSGTGSMTPGDRVTLPRCSPPVTSSPSAELYDPARGTWGQRRQYSATLLGTGKVLIAGGTQYGPSPASLSSTELYDADETTHHPEITAAMLPRR